jgi:hypothetical protein
VISFATQGVGGMFAGYEYRRLREGGGVTSLLSGRWWQFLFYYTLPATVSWRYVFCCFLQLKQADDLKGTPATLFC